MVCWRVPSKIWLGLPNPEKCQDMNLFAKALASMNEVLFCGFNELPVKDKETVVRFVMDKNNWAKLTLPKKREGSFADSSSSSSIGNTDPAMGDMALSSSNSSSSSALTGPAREKFELVPGKNGAKPHALSGLHHSPSFLSSCLPSRTFLPHDTLQTRKFIYFFIFLGKTIVLTGVFPEIGGGAGLNL